MTKHHLQDLLEQQGYRCTGTVAVSEDGQRTRCLTVTCEADEPLGLHDLTVQERQLMQDCRIEWDGGTTIHRWPTIPFTQDPEPSGAGQP
jgi:hypothetical protein